MLKFLLLIKLNNDFLIFKKESFQRVIIYLFCIVLWLWNVDYLFNSLFDFMCKTMCSGSINIGVCSCDSVLVAQLKMLRKIHIPTPHNSFKSCSLSNYCISSFFLSAKMQKEENILIPKTYFQCRFFLCSTSWPI